MGDYIEEAAIRPNRRRLLASVYLPLLVLCAWACLSRLGGGDLSLLIVVPAALWVLVAVLIAAFCATRAFLEHRFGWAIALVTGWPLSVPLFLWLLPPISEEAEM